MENRKEKRLIKNIKKGNQQSFKKLYELYIDYALRSCYFITKNQNHTADIVQETFIKVYKGLHTFDMQRSFKPWFYQILLNESKRYMKKQNIQPIAIESEQMLDFLEDKPIQKTEDNERIIESLPRLSESHRIVITLKYINEFTEKEIAELLQLNVNTVKSRLFKARGKLKKMIGGIEDD